MFVFFPYFVKIMEAKKVKNRPLIRILSSWKTLDTATMNIQGQKTPFPGVKIHLQKW